MTCVDRMLMFNFMACVDRMLMINFVTCVDRVLQFHVCTFAALLCFPLALRCHAFSNTLITLYLLSLFSLQARYCMYGSFKAGATRRTAQVLHGLGDPKSSEGASPSVFVVPERLLISCIVHASQKPRVVAHSMQHAFYTSFAFQKQKNTCIVMHH